MSNRRNRFNLFVKHSLVGGLTVLLPTAIVLFLLHWLYKTLSDLIAPLSALLRKQIQLNNFEANTLMILSLILVCFLLGNFVSTRAGHWLWHNMEGWMIRRIPGYRMVRDLVIQLVGDNKNSATKRGEVANVWLYGRTTPISVTGIITARHEDGRLTVFVPCGPNPTTGFIYHLTADLVDPCPGVRPEQLMKTAIACGAGSQAIVAQSSRRPRSPDTETCAKSASPADQQEPQS